MILPFISTGLYNVASEPFALENFSGAPRYLSRRQNEEFGGRGQKWHIYILLTRHITLAGWKCDMQMRAILHCPINNPNQCTDQRLYSANANQMMLSGLHRPASHSVNLVLLCTVL